MLLQAHCTARFSSAGRARAGTPRCATCNTRWRSANCSASSASPSSASRRTFVRLDADACLSSMHLRRADAHATFFAVWVASFGFFMQLNVLLLHLSGFRHRSAMVCWRRCTYVNSRIGCQSAHLYFTYFIFTFCEQTASSDTNHTFNI